LNHLNNSSNSSALSPFKFTYDPYQRTVSSCGIELGKYKIDVAVNGKGSEHPGHVSFVLTLKR
jgi:hypothetical protein